MSNFEKVKVGRKMWIWSIGGVIAACLVGFAIYVRTAPIDPGRWHGRAYPSGMEVRGPKSYVLRIMLDGRDPAELMSRLDDIAIQTPRTTRLAGSVQEGKVTYVTRSRLFAYPDFTSVGVYDDLIEGDPGPYLELYARSRFGQSDLGVNRQRVKRWVDALQL